MFIFNYTNNASGIVKIVLNKVHCIGILWLRRVNRNAQILPNHMFSLLPTRHQVRKTHQCVHQIIILLELYFPINI
jgi:hypothetical protein